MPLCVLHSFLFQVWTSKEGYKCSTCYHGFMMITVLVWADRWLIDRADMCDLMGEGITAWAVISHHCPPPSLCPLILSFAVRFGDMGSWEMTGFNEASNLRLRSYANIMCMMYHMWPVSANLNHVVATPVSIMLYVLTFRSFLVEKVSMLSLLFLWSPSFKKMLVDGRGWLFNINLHYLVLHDLFNIVSVCYASLRFPPFFNLFHISKVI